MNYGSFIVKILEKPFLTSFDTTNPVTQFTVQIPQLKYDGESTIIQVFIWGPLADAIAQYYRLNDYIIIEGYLFICRNLFNFISNSDYNNQFGVEISACKIYPFALNFESRVVE